MTSTPGTLGTGRSALQLALVLLFVGAAAWIPRTVTNLTTRTRPEIEDSAEWFTMDPDGHYHMRRVARAIREGRVAGTDPALNHPLGARIPWPPYYSALLSTLTALDAPAVADDGFKSHVERRVASFPRILGVLAALVLAGAGFWIAGRDAAIAAGGTFALLHASLENSALGNGDHHTFVALLLASMLFLCGAAFERLDSVRASTASGCAAGAIAGVMLGSWVASLVYILSFQLALGWRIVLHGRRPSAGLPAFGLAFHVAAAVVVAPAVLSSPWKEEFPWLVVNLSWFHLAHLALGAAIFVPLIRMRAGTWAARNYAWIIAGTLLTLGALLAAMDAGPWPAIREGFSWAGRSNVFMAHVRESEPLLGGGAGIGRAITFLGPAVLALPFAFVFAARAAFTRIPGLLPWVVVLPPIFAQAVLQRRHSEALGVPMALILGFAAAAFVRRDRLRLARPTLRTAAVIVIVLLSQGPVVSRTARYLASGGGSYDADQNLATRNRAYRSVIEWLDRDEERGRGVLASWHHGHAIEWIGDRPTVATNFGIYVGEEGYLAPWKFHLTLDPAAAEAILAERDARHVLVTDDLPKSLWAMLQVAAPERASLFLAGPPTPETVARPPFFQTIGARLLQDGYALDGRGEVQGTSLDFLRLVHVSPVRVQRLRLYPPTFGNRPFAWIWEHVPGARVESNLAAGESLRVEMEIEYPSGYVLRWVGTGEAGADGRGRVRVPYCTEAANGDGRLRGTARWTAGERSGPLILAERAVLEGETVRVP